MLLCFFALALLAQDPRLEEGTIGPYRVFAEANALIAREPANPRGYIMAATAWQRDESKALLEKALALDPSNAAARAALARYHAKNWDPLRAAPAYESALEVAPDDAGLRREAVIMNARAGLVEKARAIAGADLDLQREVIHGLIDASKIALAEPLLTELPDALARARITHAKNASQGLTEWVAAWRADPKPIMHYRFAYPRESLTRLLSRARRDKELEAVARKGIEIYPREYALYEYVWKPRFSEVKPDYTPVRRALEGEIDALLKRSAPAAELYKAAALGYDMCLATQKAEGARKRLIAEFPHSNAALMQRRAQAVQAKDPREKLRLMDAYNRESPFLPMYQEVLNTLREHGGTPDEFLKAGQDYLEYSKFGIHAVWSIGEIFVERRIHLDKLEEWMKRFPRSGDENAGAWALRLRAVEGKLLTIKKQAAAAEEILTPLPERTSQGYSNVDKGRARFYLAEALEAQDKLDAALEQYAQSYAQSQHYVAEAGKKARALYPVVKRSDAGLEDYLGVRDGMYQIAENTGIERGTPLNVPLPEFSMPTLGGKALTPESFKGKVTVMNLWATWCGPCIKELPHFEEFYLKMKNDPRVQVIAVSTDENKALVEPFIQKRGYTFPVAFEDNLRGRLGVRGIPTTFIIDATGTARIRMVGFNQNEPLVPYLEKLVNQFREK